MHARFKLALPLTPRPKSIEVCISIPVCFYIVLLRTHKRTHIYARTRKYADTCMLLHAHALTHAYAHTCTRTHTHARTYTHTLYFFQVSIHKSPNIITTGV